MGVNERKDFVKSKRLCLLCVKPNHMVLNCNYKKGCLECNGKHNGLLYVKELKFNEKKPENKNADRKKTFLAVTGNESSQKNQEEEIVSYLLSNEKELCKHKSKILDRSKNKEF